jgi:hypothetical protein
MIPIFLFQLEDNHVIMDKAHLTMGAVRIQESAG